MASILYLDRQVFTDYALDASGRAVYPETDAEFRAIALGRIWRRRLPPDRIPGPAPHIDDILKPELSWPFRVYLWDHATRASLRQFKATLDQLFRVFDFDPTADLTDRECDTIWFAYNCGAVRFEVSHLPLFEHSRARRLLRHAIETAKVDAARIPIEILVEYRALETAYAVEGRIASYDDIEAYVRGLPERRIRWEMHDIERLVFTALKHGALVPDMARIRGIVSACFWSKSGPCSPRMRIDCLNWRWARVRDEAPLIRLSLALRAVVRSNRSGIMRRLRHPLAPLHRAEIGGTWPAAVRTRGKWLQRGYWMSIDSASKRARHT